MNFSKSEVSQSSEIDVALNQLTYGIEQGNRHCLEEILQRFPSLAATKDSFLELVFTEYTIRNESYGCAHAELLAEFQQRFPQHKDELKRLFHVGQVITPLVEPMLSGSSPGQKLSPDGAADEAIPVTIGGYFILEVLGQGGMGIVYKAIQNGLDREVALKTADRIRELDHRTMAQLTREAELASHLQHPNIVQIFEVGRDDGHPFFSMEYVSGGTLADVVRQHPVAPEIAARLIATIARAVSYAHEKGVVHRDLKPNNILLSPSDRPEALPLSISGFSKAEIPGKARRFEPKIADFGLAIGLNEPNDQSRALGTPSYMAPEQIDASFGAIGVHSDVYALGALLYHCLAGRPPFQAPTLEETLHQVCEDEPQPLTNFVKKLPRDLETICNKCLQKPLENRYLSAMALADDLDRFLTHNPIQAKAPSVLVRSLKWSKRHPTATTVIVASLLAACAATIFGRAEAHRAALEIEARQRTEQMLYGNRIALANSELKSKDLDRCREILKQCDPALRDWEWRYLNASASEALFESAPKSQIANSVSLSPDGRLVAGGFGQWGKNYPQSIEVWDVREKRLIWSLEGHPPSEIASVRFNRDGTRLLSCATVWSGNTPGDVLEWDLQTGKLLRNVSAVNARVAEYSPDGRHIVVGTTRGLLQIFDASSGEPLTTHREHGSMILSLSFGPGDRLITSSRDGIVCLWSIKEGLLDRLHEMGDPREVIWHHDGKSVWVQGYSGLVQRFAIQNDKLQLLSSTQGEAFSRTAISPDHLTYAKAGFGEGIEIRMLHNDKLLFQINGHRGTVRAIGFDSNASFMASAGSDGVVRVWSLQRALMENSRSFDSRGAVADCASHPHKSELALAISNTPPRPKSFAGSPRVEIRSVDTMKIIQSVECHTDWLTTVRYSPSGKRLATGSIDSTVCVWSNNNQLEQVRTFEQHDSPIRALAFIDEQLIASVDEVGMLLVWNCMSGKVILKQNLSVPSPKTPPLICAFHTTAPDVLAIVTPQANSSVVQLVHVGNQNALRSWEVPLQATSITCNDRVGLVALGGADGSCRIYKLRDVMRGVLNPIEISKWNVSAISNLAFNPSGNRLCAAGDDEAIRLFDARSGAPLLTLDAIYRYNSLTTFSSDGETIVRIAGREFRTWTADRTSRQNDPHWAIKMARMAIDTENEAATRFYCQLAIASNTDQQAARELLLRMALLRADPSACELAYNELRSNHPGSRSTQILQYLIRYKKQADAQQLLKEWRTPELLDDNTFVNAMAWFAALLDADTETLEFWGKRLEDLQKKKEQASYANTLALLSYRQQQWDKGIAFASESLKLGGDLSAPLDWLIQLQCLVQKARNLQNPNKKINSAITKQAKTALTSLQAWNRNRRSTSHAQITNSFRERLYDFEVPLLLDELQKIRTPGLLSELPWNILDEVLFNTTPQGMELP